MPKMKTHSGAKKRFSVTGSGLVKRARKNRRHNLGLKTPKRKRNLRGAAYSTGADAQNIKILIPYK